MMRDALPAAAGAPATDAAWAALREAASAPYRAAGRWARHWARGKLAGDPVFRALLERGELPAQARVLDIGCGQGLVASLLQASADAARAGAWPAAWPAAPSASAYTGIELMTAEVARAKAALQALPLQPRFVHADMCRADFPACDLAVVLTCCTMSTLRRSRRCWHACATRCSPRRAASCCASATPKAGAALPSASASTAS